MARKKGLCFVIMPYGKRALGDAVLDFDAVFEGVYAPAGERAGFRVERSDTQGAAGSITAEMLMDIFKADVALVDVTMANANVFYELGVRHALSRFGTVLVRNAGGSFGVVPKAIGDATFAPMPLPFDIKDVTVRDIKPEADRLEETVAALAQAMELSISQEKTDSAVFHHIKGLRVQRNPAAASLNNRRTYEVVGAEGRLVGYRAGDLAKFSGPHAIDYWVSSENNMMEMARFNERSVSSTVRFLGAEEPDPTQPNFEDTVYDALRREKGNRPFIAPGDVLVTTSGRLAATHGVKRLLHACTVYGKPGEGFYPYSDPILSDAAATAMAKARALAQGADVEVRGRSIVMPLFATGQARHDPVQIASLIASRMVRTMQEFGPVGAEDADLHEAYLLAYSEDQVDLLRRVYSALEKDGDIRSVPAPH